MRARTAADRAAAAAAWQLELLELETAVWLAEGRQPGQPKARRRDRLAHEAHVDFDAIEADADATADSLAAGTLAEREMALEAMIGALRHLTDGPAVLASLNATELAGLAYLPGMAEVVTAAHYNAAPQVQALARRQAHRVLEEAQRQGVPVHTGPDPVAADPAVSAALEQVTARVSTFPASQVLDTARITAGQLAGVQASLTSVLDGIVAAVGGLSPAGPADVASQVANTATGLGRGAGARAVGQPGGYAVLAYASELLDPRTCVYCDLIDGTEYVTEAAALEDYPTGQYAACSGGGRCRGMLIYVWSSEATATI